MTSGLETTVLKDVGRPVVPSGQLGVGLARTIPGAEEHVGAALRLRKAGAVGLAGMWASRLSTGWWCTTSGAFRTTWRFAAR